MCNCYRLRSTRFPGKSSANVIVDRLRSALVSAPIAPASILGLILLGVCAFAPVAEAQGSAALGNGLSAAAIGRGGETVVERESALDAMEGNPAGLAGVRGRDLDLSALGLVAGGSFNDAANPHADLRGVAGAMPFGAYAQPLGNSRWVGSAAFTPEILMRADWHYVDPAGTAGVTYGYQQQETQIIAVRSAFGAARTFGTKWSAGVSVGIVYNQNDLHAPYIFQQQPQLAGLKVLLSLTTRGYGWNGTAGVQWQPNSRFRAGVSWKSNTRMRTNGPANGTASALFTALGLNVDPTFSYQAQVQNNLPQALAAGFNWQLPNHMKISAEGDFTAWGQSFQQLPISLTGGTNATINSVVGANHFNDAVPLNWSNQATFHGGVEAPVTESFTVRGGYGYESNPVPASTLTPLTGAIMRNSLATGAGWVHGRWHYDAAYQAQLPTTQSIGQSGLKAGEYNNSQVRVWTQSITLTARLKF